jgi:hypothetical protein
MSGLLRASVAVTVLAHWYVHLVLLLHVDGNHVPVLTRVDSLVVLEQKALRLLPTGL